MLVNAVKRNVQPQTVRTAEEIPDDKRQLPELLMSDPHIRGFFKEGEAHRPAHLSKSQFQNPFDFETWLQDYHGEETLALCREVLTTQNARRLRGELGAAAKAGGWGPVNTALRVRGPDAARTSRREVYSEDEEDQADREKKNIVTERQPC